MADAPSQSSAWLKKLEVPIEEDASFQNDRWTNRDLIPMPPDRRTYSMTSYAIYWSVSGANISAFSTASSLLAYGLTAQQAIACIVVGGLITGALSVLSGWCGEVHKIGFTVASRFSWGMKGAYFPVALRVFTSLWWFGIQGYWGGQAVAVTLSAIIPQFHTLQNTIPASSYITTKDLIGTLIWYLAYIPLVLVPPERLQRPFIVCSSAFIATLFGLLIWAVHTQGGGGPLFHTTNTASSTSYSMMLGITSILSSWGSGTIGQSDWTRYANRRFAPTVSQMVAAPVTITVTAVVGVVVTSASSEILGEVLWSPISILNALLDHYEMSSRVRAAVFFGGLSCTLAQLSINVVLNSVSTGMDMAGLAPRWINIRRGAYLLAAVSICTCPWAIVSSAGTFLSVISGLGIIIASMTGLMLADYLIIRKRTLKVEDLYIGSKESIYWYNGGFNWRAIVACTVGALPMAPGFIMSLIDPTSTSGWVRLFNISFLVGLAIGFFVFWGICTIWPPPHLGVGLNYLDESLFASNSATSGFDPRESNGQTSEVDEDKAVEGDKSGAAVSVLPSLA